MPQSPQQIAESKAQLDHVADLLSLGLSLGEIAERMGVRRPRVSQMLMTIRKQLGSQAV